jgi:hypothetical protein
MTTAETLIIFLLAMITWFLYQIARQLSYITGKRIKLSIFHRQVQGISLKSKLKKKTEAKIDEGPIEKLPN